MEKKFWWEIDFSHQVLYPFEILLHFHIKEKIFGWKFCESKNPYFWFDRHHLRTTPIKTVRRHWRLTPKKGKIWMNESGWLHHYEGGNNNNDNRLRGGLWNGKEWIKSLNKWREKNSGEPQNAFLLPFSSPLYEQYYYYVYSTCIFCVLRIFFAPRWTVTSAENFKLL
jgi:hypothetical protein